MCDCIQTVNNMLVDKNTTLMTTMFAKPERVALRTDKIVSKKRVGPAIMVATFCPFCGERYEPEPVVPA